jgi:ADP-ribose pyrophosphatase YjhB (NUDIX family)
MQPPQPLSRDYPDRPIVGVGVVVFRGEEVLLVRRGRPPRQHQWSLPGGAQHLGETVAQAAAREVREEAGIEVDLIGLVDVVDSIVRDPDGRIQYHYTLVDLAARWRAGEAVPGDDAADVTWVPLSDLGEHDLWEKTSWVIRLALAKRDRPTDS